MEPPTPEEAVKKLQEKTQGARIQTLRFLSMIGGILAGIGTLDLTGIATLFPEEVAGWLTFAGFALMSLKQGIMWLGDLIDNGKQDGSFKIGLFLLIIASSLFILPSCKDVNAVFPTVFPPDCIGAAIDYGGIEYKIGRCGGDEVAIQWKDEADQYYQAVREDDTDDLVFYRIIDGRRVPFGAKEPLPELPPEVIEEAAG